MKICSNQAAWPGYYMISLLFDVHLIVFPLLRARYQGFCIDINHIARYASGILSRLIAILRLCRYAKMYIKLIN